MLSEALRSRLVVVMVLMVVVVERLVVHNDAERGGHLDLWLST